MARNRKRTAEFKRSRSARRTKSHRTLRLALERLEPRLVLATNVLSYHMDLQSSGVNNTETQLTVGNVNTSTFGRTSVTPLDGQAYAEPLYVHGVNITAGNFQGVHNVVFAATEHDGLYAIDASGGNILWYDSFISASIPGVAITGATTISSVPNGDVNSSDINPEIGITGTPTIDLSQNAIFVITKTKQIVPVNSVNHTHYVAELFKINIQSGAVIASHVIADTDVFFGEQSVSNVPNEDERERSGPGSLCLRQRIGCGQHRRTEPRLFQCSPADEPARDRSRQRSNLYVLGEPRRQWELPRLGAAV